MENRSVDDDDEIVALLLADVAPLDLEIAECDQEDVSALLASDALRFVGDATSGFGEASDADSAFPALSAPEAQSNGDQQKPRTLLPAGAAGIQSTSAPLFVVYATASGKVETRGRKKQKPDAVVNRYRDRRREELTYLRRKVKELDHELQALQQRQQAMSAVSASTPPETGNADNATVKSLWQRIASTQKQSAQHARQENEQLRSAVEEQIKTAKMLQRVLAKKLNVATFEPSRLTCRFCGDFGSGRASNELRQKLFGALRMQYHCVDQVMSDVGLTTCTKNVHRNRVGVLEVDGVVQTSATAGSAKSSELYVEIVEARVFPFAFDEVGRTIWRFFSECQQNMCLGTYNTLEANESEIYGDYTMASPWPGSPYAISGAVAMRCCENYDPTCRRRVHVWQSLSALHPTDGDDAPVLHLRESGWSTMEPLTISPECTVAIVKVCTRMTPLPLHEIQQQQANHSTTSASWSSSSSPLTQQKMVVLEESTEVPSVRDHHHGLQTGTLSEFAIHAHQRDAAFYREIENILMAQHLQQQRAASSDPTEV